MFHQLRIYEIFEHNRDAFHTRFRDHAARLMRQHGFHIVDMWESRTEQHLEFIYLLEWPDEAALEAAWNALMADEEWSAIKRETAARHGQLVGAIQKGILRRTGYSPAT